MGSGSLRCRAVGNGGRAVRVLVVDNDPDARELVVVDLTLEGCEVVAAVADAAAAFAAYDEHRPDVAVLDVRMPGEDGVSLAGRLLDADPGARVVLYTNHAVRDVLRRAGNLEVPVVRKGDLRGLRRAVGAIS